MLEAAEFGFCFCCCSEVEGGMRDRLIVSEHGSSCYLNRSRARTLVSAVLRSTKRTERQRCTEKTVFYFLGGL